MTLCMPRFLCLFNPARFLSEVLQVNEGEVNKIAAFL